jgi:hypothetical protein
MCARSLIGLLSACLLAACGSHTSVDLSAFVGLYQVDAHTLNPSGCDVEGDPVAGSQSLFVIFPASALNTGVLAEADDCTDPADCRSLASSLAARPMSAANFAADFSQVTADGQGMAGTTFGLETSGTIAHVVDNALRKNGNTVRIEMRTYVLPCQMSGGKCDKTATVAAAASAPCSELRIVAGTFLERL